MANKFWVGGGTNTNWNSSPTTNWANSSGGTGNQTAPGTGDVAIFDGSSGTGNSVISANITVQGLDCTGGTGDYAGTITHNSGVTLTINTGAASSIRFSAGMTYTAASTTALVTFTHTTGTANITSNGKKFGGININGAGGTTQLLDDIQVNAVQNSKLLITSGAFDANAHGITAIMLDMSPNNTRALTLGSFLKIGGNITNGQQVFNYGPTGNMTYTKNSCNIEILAMAATSCILLFAPGGVTHNDLILDATSSKGLLEFNGTAGTFAHVTLNAGWGISLEAVGPLTVSNPFTWTGTTASPVLLIAAKNSPQTISVSSGACSIAFGAIQGITVSGGATFTATNSFDCGQNTGWTFSAPTDASAVLTAAEIATLGKMVDGVACGTVTTGASTTSVPTSALSFGSVAATGVVADEFKGRVIEFSGTTTTAGLRGATSAISANTGSNTPTFTVATLPATPASGDIFCII